MILHLVSFWTALKQTDKQDRHRPRASDGWWFTALVAIVYLLVSLLANFDAWAHGITHTVQAGGGDVPEEIWFLAQTPWVLVHGHNPFANSFLNAPIGVNLMDNTTMPLLGVWVPRSPFSSAQSPRGTSC